MVLGSRWPSPGMGRSRAGLSCENCKRCRDRQFFFLPSSPHTNSAAKPCQKPRFLQFLTLFCLLPHCRPFVRHAVLIYFRGVCATFSLVPPVPRGSAETATMQKPSADSAHKGDGRWSQAMKKYSFPPPLSTAWRRLEMTFMPHKPL